MKRQFQAFSYKVVNQADDTVDVYIDGTIVDAETQEILESWFGDKTSVSYKSFRDQVIKAKPKTVNVHINSGGGIVTDAMAIHDFLTEQSSKGVTVNTIGRGIVASAATYILMAGGENATLSENSWFMIHNVSGGVYGDINMIENYAAAMRKFNDSVTSFYAKATGMKQSDIAEMMNKETWMTAAEAKEKGFVKNIGDKATFSNTIQPEHWPYQNTSVLNAYNSAVRVQSEPDNSSRSFFSDIKTEFMKLIDSLTGAIKNGKDNAEFSAIDNRDAILDMVEKVLTPVINQIDEALEEPQDKPEDKKGEKSSEEKKPAAEEKSAENKSEEAAELEKLRAENKRLKDAQAARESLPENDKEVDERTARLMKNAKVEYENE